MNKKSYNYLFIMSISTLAFAIILQINSIQSAGFLIDIFAAIVATIVTLLFIIAIAFIFQYVNSIIGSKNKISPNDKIVILIETAFKIWRVLAFIIIFGQIVRFLGCVK